MLVERVRAAAGLPIRITWLNDTLIGDTCDRSQIHRMEEVRGADGREPLSTSAAARRTACTGLRGPASFRM